MKRVLLVALLLVSFCLPSIGQIRVIDEKGKVYDGFGGGPFNLGEELFRYRVINGRYPDDKRRLLDFILDKDRYESIDSVYLDYFITQNKLYTKVIRNRKNKLTVSGDTCLFYIAKERCTIQCIGGVAELQKYDSDQFHFWNFSRCYDKNGKYLWTFGKESPSLPSVVNELKTQFGYIVTMEPRHFYDSYESDYDRDEIVLENEFRKPWTAPVLVPITMTRCGAFSYDLSCLEGIQLYYQVYGDSFVPTNTIGPITIKDAFDPYYFDAIKSYMKDYMDEHEEVDSMVLWELVLFNNPPDGEAMQ